MVNRFGNGKRRTAPVFAAFLFLLGLIAGPAGATAPQAGGDEGKHGSPGSRPAWLDKMEKQIDYENMMSGRGEESEQMDKTFMRLMKKMKSEVMEHAAPASQGGAYHGSWAEHQLGMGYLLGPSEAAEKVFKGAHCPSSVPVKSYEVSAIN
ncbi:MAG: hypothetical protein HZA01_15665, partial [Nitrospinae bacterium]|nr:hypothetical protein [Nitrospinota bacterium]